MGVSITLLLNVSIDYERQAEVCGASRASEQIERWQRRGVQSTTYRSLPYLSHRPFVILYAPLYCAWFEVIEK
jgi:hypothetical protein